MKKIILTLALLVICIIPVSVCADVDVAEPDDVAEPNYDDEISSADNTVLEDIVFYLPNRILDLLDIFRVRARVGPGLAAQVRVTEPLSLHAGTYASVYAGL